MKKTLPNWFWCLWVSVFIWGCKSSPDVVFLTIDTLRADHVGAYGGSSKTPNIDSLAEDGVLFENAWSPISVTGPAFVSLHTGQHPGTHGVVMNIFRGGNALSDASETLAERLKSRGYRNGAFVSGFTLRRELGLNRGFHRYSTPKHNRRGGDKTADMALDWLGLQRGPIFLWYHSYDPHGPLKRWKGVRTDGDWEKYGANLARIPEYQKLSNISDPAFYAQRYAKAVEFADRQVGRIIQSLKDTGRYDESIIVFVSDHGESFTERQMWFDHGTTPYVEQLQVPLIIKYPKGKRAGSRVSADVLLEDVAPTVLDTMRSPKLYNADGESLNSDHVTGRQVLWGESSHCKKSKVLLCSPTGPDGKLFAVRDHAMTVIREPREDGVHTLVIDRRADPKELHPSEDAVAPEALLEQLDAMAESRNAMDLANPDEAELGEAETEALRALGYME